MRLSDNDPLLQAGPRAGLQKGRPQVGWDGAGGQVGAVEPHVHLRLEPSRLVLDTVARALEYNIGIIKYGCTPRDNICLKFTQLKKLRRI